jgi:hypothetical protein
MWRLRPADQSELARNSILISGFPDSDKVMKKSVFFKKNNFKNIKSEWLGPKFYLANDATKSGVSHIRAQVLFSVFFSGFFFSFW